MFNIGDRVVINSKMGNNIIPIIDTIVERTLMHKENIKRLKQKIKPDIQKEMKAIKLLQKQLKVRN